MTEPTDIEVLLRDIGRNARALVRLDAKAEVLRAERVALWNAARDAGLTPKAVAAAAGVTPARVVQVIGARHPMPPRKREAS